MNTQIEAPVSTEQSNPNTASVKKRMPVAVRIILCILLSVVLLADVIALAAVVTVRTVVTEDNITKIIDNTDYMTLPLTIDNIQSNLYEMFFIAFANNSTDKVDIYELVEDTDFEEFIAEKLYDYASFILYDKKLDNIDSDVIMEFYDENSSQINRAFNITYSRSELREIIEEQDEIFDKLTGKEIESAIPMIDLIRFAVSNTALIILCVLAVILIAAIGIISGSAGTPLVAVGISALITGLAVIAASVLAISGTIGISASPVTTVSIIWQGVVSSVIPDVLTMFTYISTAAVLLILTGGFIGQIRRNLRRAKKQ